LKKLVIKAIRDPDPDFQLGMGSSDSSSDAKKIRSEVLKVYGRHFSGPAGGLLTARYQFVARSDTPFVNFGPGILAVTTGSTEGIFSYRLNLVALAAFANWTNELAPLVSSIQSGSELEYYNGKTLFQFSNDFSFDSSLRSTCFSVYNDPSYQLQVVFGLPANTTTGLNPDGTVEATITNSDLLDSLQLYKRIHIFGGQYVTYTQSVDPISQAVTVVRTVGTAAPVTFSLEMCNHMTYFE